MWVIISTHDFLYEGVTTVMLSHNKSPMSPTMECDPCGNRVLSCLLFLVSTISDSTSRALER